MYATPADVAARYPARDLAQLTSPDGLVTDDAVLATALAGASAIIDGYLSARYPLPLAAPPAILGELAVDIALYRLMVNRREDDIADARARYEDAIKWLSKLAEGKIDLPPGSASADPDAPSLLPASDAGVVGRCSRFQSLGQAWS